MAVVMGLAGTGCTISLDYKPEATLEPDLASRIFEQVLMEQPRKLRPDYVQYTDKYLEYGVGSPGGGFVIGGGSGAIGLSSGGRYDVERIYWSSIGEVGLARNVSWFKVKVWNHEGRRIGIYYHSSREMAERLVDAFASMQARAPEPFAE